MGYPAFHYYLFASTKEKESISKFRGRGRRRGMGEGHAEKYINYGMDIS